MRVLITGGAGFIGSHLAERCLREGWRVSIIDDLSTGSIHNIAALSFSSRFSCHIDSTLNAAVVAKLVDRADFVFHLAAAVGVRLAVEEPLRTIHTNVQGTETVLRAAAKQRKRVLVASSSEVYGKSTAFPFHEDSDLVMGATTRARWGYACSKMLDEHLALGYRLEQDLPVTIARFFNTVGPRQSGRYGMVLPIFIKQALLGQPLTIFGDGQQRRCFTHVMDAAEALVRIARRDSTVGEVINIGNDEEVTIRALAELVKKVTGSQSQLTHVEYEDAYGSGFEDVRRRVPSLEKLKRLTGYRPRTPLSEIVRAVAQHSATLAHHTAA